MNSLVIILVIIILFLFTRFFQTFNIDKPSCNRQGELKKYLRIIFSSLNQNIINKQQLHPLTGIIKKFNLKILFHKFILSRASLKEKKRLRLPFIAEIVRFCLKQYEADYEKIKINFFTMDSNHAGSISYINNTWYIKLDEKYIENDTALITIISHEMAHYVLLKNNIVIEPNIKNEELTDATLIMAGFGYQALRAKKTWSINPHNLWYQDVSLGYLSESDIKFLIKIKRWLLKKQTFYRYQSINTSNQETLKCFVCDVSLKLPKKEGKFNINCPICLQKQTIKITHNTNKKISISDKLLWLVDKIRIKLCLI